MLFWDNTLWLHSTIWDDSTLSFNWFPSPSQLEYLRYHPSLSSGWQFLLFFTCIMLSSFYFGTNLDQLPIMKRKDRAQPTRTPSLNTPQSLIHCNIPPVWGRCISTSWPPEPSLTSDGMSVIVLKSCWSGVVPAVFCLRRRSWSLIYATVAPGIARKIAMSPKTRPLTVAGSHWGFWIPWDDGETMMETLVDFVFLAR